MAKSSNLRHLPWVGLVLILSKWSTAPADTQLLPPPPPAEWASPVDQTNRISAPNVVFNGLRNGRSEKVGQLQCIGSITSTANLPPVILGQGDENRPEVRFGEIAGTALGRAPVLYFSLREHDPDTAGPGNKRCEISYAGNNLWIPWDRDFWFALAVQTTSFVAAADQQIIWQWHEGSWTAGLSPFLAAVISGAKLSIQLRHNANDTFSQSNTTFVTLNDRVGWQANTWVYFTVQARINTVNNSKSQITIWLNGRQVADYTGPVGYLYSMPRDYAKVGLYHWTKAGNTWSPAVPKREAWFKGPVLIMHQPGYTRADVESMLQ